MPADRKPIRPIIVIKKKAAHGGHHGGAWKVAYADFVTALMSLFIVLWLMNSTPQIKKAVAGYFNDPKSGGRETGTTVQGTDQSISIDQKNVEKLKEEIQKAILKQTDLNKLSKQIVITITSEGLKIDLIEDKGGTFFQSGSPKLSDSGVELLNLLAGQLKVLPNRLLIEGHTDAAPFSHGSDYTNWELSADRANSARRLLQQGGVGPNQISQVRGFGDQMLRVPSNPLDPSNRRVSLIVQWLDASQQSGSSTAGPPGNSDNAPASSADTSAKAPPPTPTQPASNGSSGGPASAATPIPPSSKPMAAVSKPSWADRFKAAIPGKKK